MKYCVHEINMHTPKELEALRCASQQRMMKHVCFDGMDEIVLRLISQRDY